MVGEKRRPTGERLRNVDDLVPDALTLARLVANHTLRYLYLYEPDAARRARWLDALFPLQVDYDVPDEVGY